MHRAEVKDIPELVQMCKRFHEKSAYKGYIGFDENSMGQTLETTIKHPHGAVFKADGAILGAIIVPCPWNDKHLIGFERFWWSETPKAGLKVLREYESWCDLYDAHCLMVSLSDDTGGRLHKLFERRGYSPAETHYFKPRGT